MSRKSEKTESREAGRFLKVPYSSLRRHDLNWVENLLLCHIRGYGLKGCWESNQSIARTFGVSARQVTTWIAHLKSAGCLLFLHGRNYHRHLWARHHPDVTKARYLPYRNGLIPKIYNCSGQLKSSPPGRTLPRRKEPAFRATAKKPAMSQGRSLPETIEDTKINTTAQHKELQDRAKMTPEEFEQRKQRLKADLSAMSQTAKLSEPQDQQSNNAIRKD